MHLIRGELYELDVQGIPCPVKLVSIWKRSRRGKDCSVHYLALTGPLLTTKVSSKNLKRISKKDLPLYLGLKNHTPEFLDMLKNI